MIVPLKSVRIENFRGIREMTLELHPQVTVLFGSNAAGKTTVLDAIAIGLGAITSAVPQAKGRTFAKTGDIRVPFQDHPKCNESKGVECPFVRVEILAADDLMWDVSRLRIGQSRDVAQDFLGLEDLNNVILPLAWEDVDASGGKAIAQMPLFAMYGTDRTILDSSAKKSQSNTEIDRLEALDQSLLGSARFKAVFDWFVVMEDEERREREKRADFSFRLPGLEWVRGAIARAELRCRHPRIEIKPLRMAVDFLHEGDEVEPLNITALSDGYRAHFAMIVDIARRMAQLNPSADLDDLVRGTNTSAVILIDEIDLHLDPTWQSRVIRGLMQAFPNTQFIVTTHSEQVIGSVSAESVRHLQWVDGEIVAERVPFAQGATGERILVDLMGAPERVEGPMTTKLKRYIELVGDGAGRESEALALRAEIEIELQGDPLLHRADLEMQRQELVAKFRQVHS